MEVEEYEEIMTVIDSVETGELAIPTGIAGFLEEEPEQAE